MQISLFSGSTEGKIERLKEMGKTRKQLIEDVKKKRKYGELKNEMQHKKNWRK